LSVAARSGAATANPVNPGPRGKICALSISSNSLSATNPLFDESVSPSPPYPKPSLPSGKLRAINSGVSIEGIVAT